MRTPQDGADLRRSAIRQPLVAADPKTLRQSASNLRCIIGKE